VIIFPQQLSRVDTVEKFVRIHGSHPGGQGSIPGLGTIVVAVVWNHLWLQRVRGS